MAIKYRALAFTSPVSKQRIEFTYDGKIEDGVTHNLGEFQFSGVDGTYHQDKSLTTDDYTFIVLLNSQDDLRILREVLNEKRTNTEVGMLEHPDPTLGTFPAVVSSYRPAQNSVKKQGVIAVTVTWFKSIENLLGGESSAGAVDIDELNIEQATDFANSIDDSTGSALATLADKSRAIVETALDTFDSMASQVDSVYILFTNTGAEILGSIDALAAAPFNLARRIQNLIQLPMLAVDDATSRISTYTDFANTVLEFTETDNTDIAAGSPSGKNLIAAAGMASLASISAINYSALSTPSISLDEIKSGEIILVAGETVSGYLSRPQIIETIQSVLNSAVAVTDVLSQKAVEFNAPTFFTQYFDFSILNKRLVTATVKNLNLRIFNTAREIIYISDIELPPIHHCAEKYKSVENNTINFFISSNNLHGDEIYIVPKGRELVYYV